PLAQRFLAFLGRGAGRQDLTLSPEAEEVLRAYRWPGNLRELRNAIERAVILWPARVISPGAFPENVARAGKTATDKAPAAPELGGDFTLDDLEREHILRVLARTATLEEAAEILGIDSSTLYRKRKRYEAG